MSITIAWGTALLVVPRAAKPDALPAAMIEPREAEAIARRDAALSRAAVEHRLDGYVRRLGSAVRAYGAAESAHDDDGQANAKRSIEAALPRTPSAEEVLRLRAYQTLAFLAGLRRWEATGTISEDLTELGGSFAELAKRNEWLGSDGYLLADDTALRAMFKKRYNELLGLRDPTFALAPAEQRALAGFLYLHPPLPPGGDPSPAAKATFADQQRMKKLAELEQVDPTFPSLYARGILFYRLGSYAEAVDAFGRYVDATPSGPYRQRAVNYMRSAFDAGQLLDE